MLQAIYGLSLYFRGHFIYEDPRKMVVVMKMPDTVDSTFVPFVVFSSTSYPSVKRPRSFGILTICHMDKTLVWKRDQNRLPISL